MDNILYSYALDAHIIQNPQQYGAELFFLAQSEQDQGVLFAGGQLEFPRRRYFTSTSRWTWKDET